MPPLLQLRDIALTFGGAPLLNGAELSISQGDRIALVGRNGSGKSTLLRIAAGQATPDRGTQFVQPTARLAYLPQEPDLSGFATALDYVLAGLGEHDDEYAARGMMAELGLGEASDPMNLSGGEARRAALVRALAPEPDILLLDEPTNHLDLIAIEWLEAQLAGCRSALALVSHDKRLLADLTEATVWLDRGATHRLDRGFGAFEAWRDKKLEEEELERHRLDRRIVNEERWMRYGVTARRKRNMRRVAELSELRRERREARRAVGLANMVVQEASPSGALAVEAERISKAYEGNTIVRDFSLRIMRGDRIGVIGANGSGKTTLINLLTGAIAPDSGTVRVGSNVLMASLDQTRGSLQPTTTLVDALTGGGSDSVTINGERRHVIGYMADFLFPPEQARTPIGKLSGGERGRLMLARALAAPSNLLALDEPTNDLDIETLDLLQELLSDYAGTILIVSHDRDFLDRVATSVIVSEGGGRWTEYAGGYSDMVAQRGYGLAGPAAPAAPAVPTAPAKPAIVRAADRSPAQAQAELQRKARARGASRSDRDVADRAGGARAQARRRRSRPSRAGRLSGGDRALWRGPREPRKVGGRMAGARNPARGSGRLRFRFPGNREKYWRLARLAGQTRLSTKKEG